MIYLDNAATTLQKPQEVYRSMEWAVRNLGSPGRGGHKFAMNAAEIAFNCREKAAKLFDLDNPENVVFTFNATHALNIAINSVVKAGDRVVISGYEHNSAFRPLIALNANIDIASSQLFNQESTLDAFKKKLSIKTDAVVITHVSNVFGYILPIDEIAKICSQKGIALIIDASQSAGCMDISMKKLNAAFIAMPGHKGLYGPQGTGILLCNTEPKPFMFGGSGSNSMSPEMPDFLPDRLEAGTHNMPGIAGLSSGLSFIINKNTSNIFAHEKNLIELMEKELRKIPSLEIYSDENGISQSGMLSFNFKNISPETGAEILSKNGIAVRAGLHCSPLSHKSAGTFPEGTIRASVSAFTSANDIRKFITVINNIAIANSKN